MITAATQQDQKNAAMVRAIIGLARELNIGVIAQGVETEAQRRTGDATEMLLQRLIEPRLCQVSGEAAAQ